MESGAKYTQIIKSLKYIFTQKELNLRQRRWLELLSRKPKGSGASLITTNPYLLRELERFQVEIVLPCQQPHLAALQITSPLVERIKQGQQGDAELRKMIEKVEGGSVPEFTTKDGILKFKNRLCVPNNS